MVLKCMKFTRKTSLVQNYNGLAMIKFLAPIFAFTYYCTRFMHNLAYPMSFSLIFIFCNFHSMFIVVMVLKVRMSGLLSHFCIVSFVLHMFSFFFLSSDFFHLHILPFFSVTVLSTLVAYAKSVFCSYLYIFIIFY